MKKKTASFFFRDEKAMKCKWLYDFDWPICWTQFR